MSNEGSNEHGQNAWANMQFSQSIHSLKTQSMDEDEDLDQNLDPYPYWICQYGPLKEHLAYALKYQNLTC